MLLDPILLMLTEVFDVTFEIDDSPGRVEEVILVTRCKMSHTASKSVLKMDWNDNFLHFYSG
jgi:hypothetical protein